MDTWVMPVWTEKYSVGNDVLDRQHQQLLSCCMRAVECLRLDDATFMTEMRSVLDELSEYVATHFRTEEAMMQVGGYPDIDAHKREHALYEAKLTEFIESANDVDFDRAAFIHYITDWWADHIGVTDRSYMPWINRAAGH